MKYDVFNACSRAYTHTHTQTLLQHDTSVFIYERACVRTSDFFCPVLFFIYVFSNDGFVSLHLKKEGKEEDEKKALKNKITKTYICTYTILQLTTQRVGAPIASAAESYVQNMDKHLWEHMKKYSLNHIEDGIRGLK